MIFGVFNWRSSTESRLKSSNVRHVSLEYMYVRSRPSVRPRMVNWNTCEAHLIMVRPRGNNTQAGVFFPWLEVILPIKVKRVSFLSKVLLELFWSALDNWRMSLFLVSCLLLIAGPVLAFPGESLRVNELFETTSWDLLEDMYLYHNAIRYYHGASSLKFNRTVSQALK